MIWYDIVTARYLLTGFVGSQPEPIALFMENVRRSAVPLFMCVAVCQWMGFCVCVYVAKAASWCVSERFCVCVCAHDRKKQSMTPFCLCVCIADCIGYMWFMFSAIYEIPAVDGNEGTCSLYKCRSWPQGYNHRGDLILGLALHTSVFLRCTWGFSSVYPEFSLSIDAVGKLFRL